MSNARRIPAALATVPLFLAFLGNGGTVYLCIGADGHVGLKTTAAPCGSCCGRETETNARTEGCSPVDAEQVAEDVECCVDIPVTLSSGQAVLFVPSRTTQTAPPAAPDAHLDRATEARDLLTSADPWKPPWPTPSAVLSLRTVVLLI